ncbi:hypothetical protein [Streptomyces murinus]|uniref:hypothetical protein n=1 Tax=Streptomyces murinus TaxID=33900 RepID=UPI003F460D89
MHHHGYLWTGPKEQFDHEALRRPPHPEPPPAGSKPELIQRYHEVAMEFQASSLPPLETAYWLIKPPSVVKGTWDEAHAAVSWLGEQLIAHSPRFATERDRDADRLTRRLNTAAERLRSGADVSYGFYLERPSYLSLAVVTCCPNRSKPELVCPIR